MQITRKEVSLLMTLYAWGGGAGRSAPGLQRGGRRHPDGRSVRMDGGGGRDPAPAAPATALLSPPGWCQEF